MKEVLKCSGAFLFAVLLLAKVSAFHIYEHQNEADGQDTQCEYCILAIDSQQADILLPTLDIVENNNRPSTHDELIISNDFQVNLSPSKTEQLPRPPPAVL